MPKFILSPTSKGQITIPAALRKRFKIGTDSLLQFSAKNGTIIITPLKIAGRTIRQYTDDEIKQFQENDKIASEDAKYFDQILNG